MLLLYEDFGYSFICFFNINCTTDRSPRRKVKWYMLCLLVSVSDVTGSIPQEALEFHGLVKLVRNVTKLNSPKSFN